METLFGGFQGYKNPRVVENGGSTKTLIYENLITEDTFWSFWFYFSEYRPRFLLGVPDEKGSLNICLVSTRQSMNVSIEIQQANLSGNLSLNSYSICNPQISHQTPGLSCFRILLPLKLKTWYPRPTKTTKTAQNALRTLRP